MFWVANRRSGLSSRGFQLGQYCKTFQKGVTEKLIIPKADGFQHRIRFAQKDNQTVFGAFQHLHRLNPVADAQVQYIHTKWNAKAVRQKSNKLYKPTLTLYRLKFPFPTALGSIFLLLLLPSLSLRVVN